jgi:putative tryptophan/tyrosine transport system substrate-binding protein
MGNINPTSPNLAEAQKNDLQAAARNLNLRIHLLNASTEDEFETVFAKITELHAGGLVISSDSFSSHISNSLPLWLSKTRCPRSLASVSFLRQAA